MTLSLHRLPHFLPLWPSARIVRTRGEVNQTALVVIWLWWALDVELRP